MTKAEFINKVSDWEDGTIGMDQLLTAAKQYSKALITPKQKVLKEVAIAFTEFLDEDCIRSFKGWCLKEYLVDTEFELDELYDFWRAKILNETIS